MNDQETCLSLSDAATILGVDPSTLLFLIDEMGLALRPGPRVLVTDLVRLRRHPDLEYGFERTLEAEREEHNDERCRFLERVEHLERELAARTDEIETLRRVVLVGQAARRQAS